MVAIDDYLMLNRPRLVKTVMHAASARNPFIAQSEIPYPHQVETTKVLRQSRSDFVVLVDTSPPHDERPYAPFRQPTNLFSPPWEEEAAAAHNHRLTRVGEHRGCGDGQDVPIQDRAAEVEIPKRGRMGIANVMAVIAAAVIDDACTVVSTLEGERLLFRRTQGIVAPGRANRLPRFGLGKYAQE